MKPRSLWRNSRTTDRARTAGSSSCSPGWRRGAACALSTAWLLLAPLSAAQLPQINVRIQTYVEISSSTLRDATETAGHTLLTAGIRVAWADCSPSQDPSIQDAICSEPVTPVDLQVRIIGEDMAKRVGRGTSCMGYAVTGGEFGMIAAAYLHRAAELESRNVAHRSVILGGILAHEIGHLLGVKEHSAAGVMRGAWTDSDLKSLAKGQFGFNPRQSIQMMEEVRKRVKAAQGEPATAAPREARAR
jgi:hypothetical protein